MIQVSKLLCYNFAKGVVKMARKNQNLLLSRILTYMNGTLFNDYYFKIGMFIIFNYINIENMSKIDFLEAGPFKNEELDSFIGAFGFDNYEDFQFTLYNDYQIRLNQIRVRLIDVKPQQFLEKMDMPIGNKELSDLIKEMCEKFYHAKRIVIFGALYPISLAVELQTDMITFGKPFIQYHIYNPIHLDHDDVAIIVSGTGRALNNMKKNMKDVHIEKAYSVLFTQNKIYLNQNDSDTTKTLVLPGKFESVDFNYQLMAIYDLLRLNYFQQYYL